MRALRSFARRLFGRKDSPATSAPGASPETWAVGDVAECVGCGVWFCYPTGAIGSGPLRGDTHRVTAIDILAAPIAGEDTYLSFSPWPRKFSARDFRKVEPRADALVRAEPEFLALIKRPPVPVKATTTNREPVA
jgi:hypothetical protein